MIFLSHNFKDKPVVEPIAIELRKKYGQENIFYDSWSIRPGEGIIDKMNLGLSKTDIFFLFVSDSSLNSKMVSLEWQSTLMRTGSHEIQLIPVRISDCNMPVILTQHRYIDFYNVGFKETLTEMFSVIENKDEFAPSFEHFSNLSAVVERITDREIHVQINSLNIVEQNPVFGIFSSNVQSDITFYPPSENGLLGSGYFGSEHFTNYSYNLFLFELTRPLTPTTPFELVFLSKSVDVSFQNIVKIENKKNFLDIPFRKI